MYVPVNIINIMAVGFKQHNLYAQVSGPTDRREYRDLVFRDQA